MWHDQYHEIKQNKAKQKLAATRAAGLLGRVGHGDAAGFFLAWWPMRWCRSYRPCKLYVAHLQASKSSVFLRLRSRTHSCCEWKDRQWLAIEYIILEPSPSVCPKSVCYASKSWTEDFASLDKFAQAARTSYIQFTYDLMQFNLRIRLQSAA